MKISIKIMLDKMIISNYFFYLCFAYSISSYADSNSQCQHKLFHTYHIWWFCVWLESYPISLYMPLQLFKWKKKLMKVCYQRKKRYQHPICITFFCISNLYSRFENITDVDAFLMMVFQVPLQHVSARISRRIRTTFRAYKRLYVVWMFQTLMI